VAVAAVPVARASEGAYGFRWPCGGHDRRLPVAGQ